MKKNLKFTALPLYRFTALPLYRFTALPLYRFTAERLLLYITVFLFSFLILNKLVAQSDPVPFECGMCCGVSESGSFPVNCAHTSTLWSSNARHIPRTDARPINVRVNFIILRKSDDPDPDIQGNFSQNNPEHMAFLNEIVDNCNGRLSGFYGTSDCLDLRTDTKIQIVPNFIFLKDEVAWNADNTPGVLKCPSQTQSLWHLANLSNQINSDPSIPKGINVFFPVQGDLYNRLVILGTIDNPDYPGSGLCRWWCSEPPSNINLARTSSISVTNLYMKYRWFQLHPEVTGFPFDPTGRDLMIDEAIKSLPHELGHSFIDDYVHFNGCTNHLMRTGGGGNDVIRATDIGCMHRNLARANLRQFVDCTETYNMPGSNTSDRVVNVSEVWDLNMRLYTNVVVKAPAVLTITCELLMPFDGTITVERGAKLIIDGGNVRRANTCSPAQFWRGIAVQGNNAFPQPDPAGALPPDLAGAVLLRGNGMIEGAVIGVAAKGHPIWDVPQFRGGVIDANGFTFKDCRKGAEFMKYDRPNRSRFIDVLFDKTATGTMHTGVSIWDTDGILFEKCTLNNMATYGIVSWDAVFNVKQKNRFYGSEFGVHAGASTPLMGQVTVGVLGLKLADRNKFEGNIVGIKATSNLKSEVFSNDFDDIHFDVAVNGTAQSTLIDNYFASPVAGNQFENTGNNRNENLCNRYGGNSVGTNIVGHNPAFLFRQEDFATDFHDLFLEAKGGVPGEIEGNQGGPGSPRWNFFTSGKAENIKTSTAIPNNDTELFYYYHPDPNINQRLKPTCALGETCTPQSNFENELADGPAFDDCIFPGAQQEPCYTKPCLDAIRIQIAQTTALYNNNPTTQLAAQLQSLINQREAIVNELIRGYLAYPNWSAIESLLNEDMNLANQRRMVGAKLEQSQFSAANALLQSFPQTTLHDQYFVQVQNINIARISNPSFVLSSSQEALLLDIAEASSPEAGYAQTILGLLTGRTFMPRLPDLGGERSAQPISKPEITEGLWVSPNPVSDFLEVRVPQRANQSSVNQTLELYEMATGKLVQTVRLTDTNAFSIAVQTLPAGLYLLNLEEQGIAIARQKIVIQH